MPLKSALYVCLAGLCILVASCRQDNRPLRDEAKDDSEAKAMLQGIWVDSESEDVVFKVSGDSVYYPDATSLPSFFKIKADTLIIGNPPSHYPIMKQMPNVFWFRNQTGDVVKLRKSDDPNVALAFFHKRPVPLAVTEVVKRDTVVMYRGERYHCYVAINPTKYKVIRKTYNDDGVEVDNIYYDNIIHVSVFRGAQRLYSRDFRKTMFAHLVPRRFLAQAVLNNVEYDHVDAAGFHFSATLCIPDAASCYMLDAVVSFAGDMRMEVIDY